MAVSKSLRYQILRRDNHACRYCGATAPDATLRIDHVVAVTLGGSDDPSNLVTACFDCNASKSATPADAAFVADVAQDALRWAAAMQRAAESTSKDRAGRDGNRVLFAIAWDKWYTTTRKWSNAEGGYVETHHPIPREDNWETSVDRWIELGLTIDDLEEAVKIAMRSKKPSEATWKWFCGIAWKMLRDRQDAAKAILDAEDVEPEKPYHPSDVGPSCDGRHPAITSEVWYAASTYYKLAELCDKREGY